MKSNQYNYNSQSGMYRHKILLKQVITTLDELLQEIETTQDYGSYWAMIKTLKAQEIQDARQEQMQIQTRFVVKYSKSLDAFIQSDKTSFEVVYKDIIYDVKDAINDNELNETITILAEGRV